MRSQTTAVFCLALGTLAATARAQGAGSSPVLTPPRITQAMITSGSLSLDTIRTHGLRMFASPFNKLDGYGDGPMDPLNPTPPGHRPTLQNNGTFLRVNGLDAQTCMECHSIVSAASVPFQFGIGGVGGANNNAMAGPTTIDVNDSQSNGFAAFNGRFINPPFLFGAGGVELLAKEMTADLQAKKVRAQSQPGVAIPLITKGVDFGTITFTGGVFDTSQVVGVDADLVVRPFGRKGEFATTRAFDVAAMQFHFGMQPVEVVGNSDADGDGVTDEVLIGELSSLSIFTTTLERPQQRNGPHTQQGSQLFSSIGCANCHRPQLDTTSSMLTYSFPEVPADPFANLYYAVDLHTAAPKFQHAPGGGIRVELFSDLKRHDMGPGLAESTGGTLDAMFITARLWGVADTAPYLHDGRALNLRDAILLHGGEALAARNAFAALSNQQQEHLITFLRSLHTPKDPGAGLRTENL
ncbi:MAG TPA: di-heme oxidoredictase family protein [Planctomycetota bacterium]|nr:di-heme oxidoredictase family protein [Planctomycetota bacterium]